MPGEKMAQYRRNSRRDSGSVVITRVRVRNTDVSASIGSTERVQTIFA